MVNKLLNAVTMHLGTTFGDHYHYYVEDVKQGLVKPCFTADVLLPTQRSRSPYLYDRTFPLVVHYFSDSKHNIKKNCYEMGERLVECLEYLPFEGGLIRGEDISWQIVDEVLQLFITYRIRTTTYVAEENSIDEVEFGTPHVQ